MEYGFGAIATEDIKMDEVYLSLDYHSIMNDELIYETDIGELIEEINKILGKSNPLQLMFYLMIHK